jgi:mannose-6-phosphate isomerase-like protein (cupin superfamily)
MSGAIHTPGSTGRDEALAMFSAEGCDAPSSWSSGPGDTFGWHAHERDKVLVCVEGSIVFRTEAGETALEAGDRLDLPAGTRHAAVAGPRGCACVEAWR